MKLIDRVLDKSIFMIAFFIYSGFYAVLAIVIAVGGNEATRVVTVPIRLTTTVTMLIIIVLVTFFKRQLISSKKKIYIFIFTLFWSLYFLKLLHHYNGEYPLRLSWYEYILYAFNFSILPFLVFILIPFEKYKKTILNSLIFSGFVMGAVTLYLYKDLLVLGVGIRLAKYASSDFSETLNPLSLSYASVLTIALCMFKFLYVKERKKLETIYLVITIGLSLIMFLLGASRGSILAFLLSLIYLISQSNFKKKIQIISMVTISIPLLIWSVAVSGSSIFKRTVISAKSGSTGREELWTNAWNEFLANPIIGGRIEIGFHPHNIFLETLMALGIIGFIILMTLMILSLTKAFLLPKVDKNYIWVSLILIQGISQNSFSGALYGAVLVFFSIGLILSYTYDSRNQQSFETP